ncbi:hypothetical protein JZ751_006031 [Albula glossodonta]|uniref:Anaphase-promoting complex subunit 10 n=1 Tax=Albula glossodonta TaxID=121402 RepID=A0A8T2P3N9_9TELE|nr:hypothetical protein JZ751_006031 [Albula glossodonta]
MATASKTPPGADPKQLERTGTVREIGSQAVWSLSSCKPDSFISAVCGRKTTVKMLCIYADYKSDESYTPSKISVRVGNNFHNLQEIRQAQRSHTVARYGMSSDRASRPAGVVGVTALAPGPSVGRSDPKRTPELAPDGWQRGVRGRDRSQNPPPSRQPHAAPQLFRLTPQRYHCSTSNTPLIKTAPGDSSPQLEMVEPSGWIHIPLLDLVNSPIRTFMIQIAVLANHQNGRDTHMRQIKVYTPVEESSIGKYPRCTTVDFMMYRTIR